VLTIRHQTYTLASLAASILLTSCVIPIPPHHLGTEIRRNLGERVPDFIVPTVTTREDVLMHLGEADYWPPDESELSYHTGVYRGGVLVFLIMGGGGIGYGYSRELYRTLTVEFDKAGLVKSARLKTESCSVHDFGMGGATGPMGSNRNCVPVAEPVAPGDVPKAGGPELED
jgi:hypothetical protein